MLGIINHQLFQEISDSSHLPYPSVPPYCPAVCSLSLRVPVPESDFTTDRHKCTPGFALKEIQKFQRCKRQQLALLAPCVFATEFKVLALSFKGWEKDSLFPHHRDLHLPVVLCILGVRQVVTTEKSFFAA